MFADFWLENIHKVGKILRGSCNAGVTTSDTMGTLLGVFEVWVNMTGIANLLSLPQLEEDGFRIRYDTLA